MQIRRRKGGEKDLHCTLGKKAANCERFLHNFRTFWGNVLGRRVAFFCQNSLNLQKDLFSRPGMQEALQG